MQHFEQLRDVVEVQARRRLVQDVERAAGRAARQLLGELHPLRLAAGQRRRLLADLDVGQAPTRFSVSILSRIDGTALNRLGRLFHRHVEHVGDRLVPVTHLQRLAVVAFALADVAGDIDVGQKVHLDLDDAVALAGFAAAALDVEREPPRQIAARLGLGQGRRTSRGLA